MKKLYLFLIYCLVKAKAYFADLCSPFLCEKFLAASKYNSNLGAGFKINISRGLVKLLVVTLSSSPETPMTNLPHVESIRPGVCHGPSSFRVPTLL